MANEKILVIDDDTYIRNACVEYLTAEGYGVHSAQNGEEGLEINSKKGPFDLIITDLKMPGIDGIEVLKSVKEMSVKTDVIVITAHGTIENAVEAMRFGAYDYLTKTFNIDELDHVVKRCLEKRRLTTEVRELKELINLYEASKAISSLMGIDELLNLMLRLVCDTLAADGGSIMLYDPELGELSVKAALGARKDEIIGKKLNIGERVAGLAVQQEQPVSIQGKLKDDPRFSKLEAFDDIASGLTMPLARKGKLLGVINLKRKKQEHLFSKRDENLLSIFAVEAAIAMENNYLFNKLEQEKKELDATFAGMADGAVVTDEALNVIRMNSSAETLIGRSYAESIGKNLPQLARDFEPSVPWNNILNLGSGPKNFELVRKKGKTLFLSAADTAIETADNKAAGHIMVLRNITAEKMEERKKMDFLSIITHKLKTPLTTILGYSSLLASKTDVPEDKLRQGMESIKRQGDLLNELVDKLLRFTLLNSEYSTLNREKASVSVIIERCLKGFSYFISAGEIEVAIDPEIEKLPPVWVDQMKITEALESLVDNGTKFNDKPKKQIKITGKKLDDKFVLLEVSDNGNGIPSEELSKIFLKFYQIDEYLTGQIEGIGLGLALVKQLIELHGGKIWAESQLERGSKFSLTLPISQD